MDTGGVEDDVDACGFGADNDDADVAEVGVRS